MDLPARSFDPARRGIALPLVRDKVVSTVPYKLLGGNSPDLQLYKCSWGQG